MKKTLLLCCIFSLNQAFSQSFARSWDAWFGQLQGGVNYGLQDLGPLYTMGIYKSAGNHGFGVELSKSNLAACNIISGSATLSQDLLRIRRNRRTPFYFYATLGVGLTHLKNNNIQDNFLLKGDDMVHASFSISPTYFFSRDFALQWKTQISQYGLVDYELKAAYSSSLGILFLIPAFKPF
ncbi:MAG: hypothetical protein RLZZ65_1582 [Bacteroidota bacterium]|jgi:hypothetical protein